MGNTRQQQNMNILHLILQTNKQKFTLNVFPDQFFLAKKSVIATVYLRVHVLAERAVDGSYIYILFTTVACALCIKE